MARLELYLLGPLEVTLDGKPVTQFESNKVRALLAYLAVEADRPHRRDALATLLWPDRPHRAGRVNLRTALANLRSAIGDRDADPPFLLITRDAIQFNPASDCWVDVARFRALVEPHPPEDPSTEQLEEAVGLYRGPFLEGFSLRDSAAFDDWSLLTQERLHRQALTALHWLAREVERNGELGRACEVARRQVELEPWQEEAHRELMRLLALTGQRSAALAQYEACRETLMQGLGVEPEEETTLLYERIRDGVELPSPFRGPPHNLPLPLLPLIGREDELAEIQARLQDTECRLLTVIGPGGIGKSRLALQAAADELRHFSHGVYLVNLAPVSSPELLASTIMEAMNLPLHGSAHPRVQLLNALREKALLLLLDNFEHLLTGTPLVTQMLRAAPGVKLLVTSRERLNLRDEWLLPLQGLRYPEEHIIGMGEDGLGGPGEVATPEERASILECYSAVQLFEQCARRVQPGFSLAQAGPWSAARICQLVEGMPLAIELAAPWIRMMPCQEIAQHIERDLGLLASSLRDMPQRHRSMRAVFDHSWKLLAAEEREVLAKLSVFRGGFRRGAAEAVATRPSQSPASLATLSSLVDKSWLRVTPSGRYEMHELVRQYAAERLEGNLVEADQVRDRHSDYFTMFLHEQEAHLLGWRQKEALEEIMEDVDNVRLAWDWAVQHGNTEALARSAESLWMFSERRGLHRETERQFARAAARLREQLSVTRSEGSLLRSEETAIALAQILCWQAQHWFRLGSLERAIALAEESLALVRDGTPNPRRKKACANTQVWLGGFLDVAGRDRSRSSRLYREGLAGAVEVGDKWIELIAQWFLGGGALRWGRYLEAEEHLRRSVALADQTGDAWTKSWCLNNLAEALRAQGDYEAAERVAAEGLHISQAVGDRVGVGMSLLALAGVVTALEKYEEAGQRYRDALVLADELGDPGMKAMCYDGQAKIAAALGNHAEAEELFERSFALATEMGDQMRLVEALIGLGYAALALGDARQPRKCFRDALEGAMDAGYVPLGLDALVGLAHLLSTENQPQRAVEFLALTLRHPATCRKTRDRARSLLSELESTLAPEALAAATARGRACELEEVVAEILARKTSPTSPDSKPRSVESV